MPDAVDVGEVHTVEELEAMPLGTQMWFNTGNSVWHSVFDVRSNPLHPVRNYWREITDREDHIGGWSSTTIAAWMGADGWSNFRFEQPNPMIRRLEAYDANTR